MRKTRKVRLEHNFDRYTQRKARYKQAYPARNDIAREAEIPYVYVDKDFLVNVLSDGELGVPPVVEIEIRGIYPEADSGVKEYADS